MHDEDAALAEYQPRKPAPSQPGGAEASAPDDEARKAVLGSTVSRRIREAQTAREASGIEQIWQDDSDQYEGIDELTVNTRPGLATETRDAEGTTPRSRVFINITKPKTQAGTARVQEMLVPHDDKPWEIGPTPIPELVAAVDGKDQAPLTLADGTQAPAELVAKAMMDKAKVKAEKMSDWIEDQLVEGSVYSELRKVVRDGARIGTGILKGPFPTNRESRTWALVDGVSVLEVESKLAYTSKRIDPRDFFPDPACGESMHDGSYVAERAYMTARQLRKLAFDDGYDRQAIAMALKEGPKRKARTDTRDTTEGVVSDSQVFEVWFYYGDVEPEDLMAMGTDVNTISDTDLMLASVPSIVTMLNDRPIKAVVNPLETGEFPYDVFPWEPVEGQIWGRGIPRKMAVAQRGLNAGARAMLRNAGLSAGAQIAVMEGALSPANGAAEIVGDKLWLFRPTEFCDDIRKAMNVWTIPSAQVELANIIAWFTKLADEMTNLPMLMQGTQGEAPELLGGMQMLMANAQAPLRVIAKQFDDYLIVPHWKRYYAAGMQAAPEECKGDHTIKARGATALVQREIAREFYMQAYTLAQRPGSRIDPDKLDAEMFRSNGVSLSSITYNDEEWQAKQEAASQQPPPQDPRVEAAHIRAEGDKAANEARAATAELDRQQRAADGEAMRAVSLQLAAVQRDIQIMRMAAEENMQISTIKADLAAKAVESRDKRELYAAEAALKMNPENPTDEGI